MSEPVDPRPEFTLTAIAQDIGAHLSRETDAIGEVMEELDGNDPFATFQLEMMVAKYRAEIGVMASLVKQISDVQQMIIQKI